MRRFIVFLPILLVVCSILIPAPVEAANTSLLQIVPQVCLDCPTAPDWGCVLETIRNLINTAIAFGAIVSVLIIAYAGALWMFSPFHAGNREKGRTLLLNAVIGLAIALAAWLIVDFVMKNLYNPQAGQGSVALGPWNSILSGGNECVTENRNAGRITAPNLGQIVGTQPGGTQEGTPGQLPDCPTPPNPTVSRGANAVVSDAGVDKLKDILRAACISSATITSGRRTAADQARVMYQNIEQYGVSSQMSLYGRPGQQVIQAYVDARAANPNATAAEVQAAMLAKIQSLSGGCVSVSRHCSTQDVIDVAPSSISNQSAFRTAVQQASTVSLYIFPPSDPAFHIEFR